MNIGKIIVVGIGPGSEADMTPAVADAIRRSDVVVGYRLYFKYIQHCLGVCQLLFCGIACNQLYISDAHRIVAFAYVSAGCQHDAE